MPSRTDAVAIGTIIADSRCQSRTGIDLALVQEYAEAIKEGAALPPLSTIHAPEGYYLYDGFHRLEAYRQAGAKHIVIETDPGDVWDAIERSCAVNAIHGKRRTPADTRNAVAKIIEVMHHRGVKWSHQEIADRCALSRPRVTQLLNGDLAELSSKYLQDAPTTVTRNGKTYEMDTSNIGKKWNVPDVRAQLAEDVDEGTGEILDNDPPPYEEVDASDPATWFPPAPQRSAPQTAPAPRAEQRTITLVYRDYGPDHRRLSARSLALELDAEFGDGFARMVGQEAS